MANLGSPIQGETDERGEQFFHIDHSGRHLDTCSWDGGPIDLALTGLIIQKSIRSKARHPFVGRQSTF